MSTEQRDELRRLLDAYSIQIRDWRLKGTTVATGELRKLVGQHQLAEDVLDLYLCLIRV